MVVLKHMDDDAICNGCQGDDSSSDIESDGIDDDDESGAEESVSEMETIC